MSVCECVRVHECVTVCARGVCESVGMCVVSVRVCMCYLRGSLINLSSIQIFHVLEGQMPRLQF